MCDEAKAVKKAPMVNICGRNRVVLTMESKGEWDNECSTMANLTMECNGL